MRRSFFISAAVLFLSAWVLGPLTQRAYGAERQGYRSHTYRSRPTYRGRSSSYRPQYHATYRPYYRSGYRAYGRSYYPYRPYYGGYWPSYYYYRPFYYGPYYYGPSSYASWGWGYPAPYVQLRYSYYGGGAVDYSYEHGAVRIEIRPKQAQVYVDGYYAGIVDDFDGTFQRLYLPPGQHEILVRLDGYRTYRQTLNVNSGTTYKLHHEMELLGPGETTPPPPEPSQQEGYGNQREGTAPQRDAYAPRPPPQEEVPRSPEPRTSPIPERSTEMLRSPATPARFGLLSLHTQPDDVQVYIDDELWGSLAGIGELTIHLPAGRRRIEVRKDGFLPFLTEIEIRQGETTPLNVKLERTN